MASRNGVRPRFRVPPKRTAVLKFTDGDYQGAQVECSLDVSTGMILEFARIGDEAVSPSEFDTLLRKFGRFFLLNWNLEDNDGEPIPASAEGMSSIPSNFAIAVINAWSDAVIGVPDPLGSEPNSGDSSKADMTMQDGQS